MRQEELVNELARHAHILSVNENERIIHRANDELLLASTLEKAHDTSTLCQGL